jgi:hypothetical protein
MLKEVRFSICAHLSINGFTKGSHRLHEKISDNEILRNSKTDWLLDHDNHPI